MAKKKPKFYVVWEGNTPGVYKNWSDCQTQISGFSGAKYKSFPSLAAAEKAYTESAAEHWGSSEGTSKSKSKTPKRTLDELKEMGVDITGLAVDAACKGNPGPLEYQGVEIASNVNLFHQGPFPEGTVNIGEFLAIVHALALLKHGGHTDRVIYSDSRIGMGWVKAKKCKTKQSKTVANKTLFQLVTRAEKWLKENPVENPIRKWETKLWGEIPADFGRK
ncbi:MAG: viroplasmin family protein [Mariniblastus sp.]